MCGTVVLRLRFGFCLAFCVALLASRLATFVCVILNRHTIFAPHVPSPVPPLHLYSCLASSHVACIDRIRFWCSQPPLTTTKAQTRTASVLLMNTTTAATPVGTSMQSNIKDPCHDAMKMALEIVQPHHHHHHHRHHILHHHNHPLPHSVDTTTSSNNSSNSNSNNDTSTRMSDMVTTTAATTVQQLPSSSSSTSNACHEPPLHSKRMRRRCTIPYDAIQSALLAKLQRQQLLLEQHQQLMLRQQQQRNNIHSHEHTMNMDILGDNSTSSTVSTTANGVNPRQKVRFSMQHGYPRGYEAPTEPPLKRRRRFQRRNSKTSAMMMFAQSRSASMPVESSTSASGGHENSSNHNNNNHNSDDEWDILSAASASSTELLETAS